MPWLHVSTVDDSAPAADLHDFVSRR